MRERDTHDHMIHFCINSRLFTNSIERTSERETEYLYN